jgi:hypothetical protein
MAHATRELGLRRLRAQASGDRGERRVAPGPRHEQRRRPATHRRAEESAVAAAAERCRSRHDTRAPLDREPLAREARLGHEEIPCREHQPVSRHEVTGRKLDDIAGHELRGWHGPQLAVTAHAYRQREPRAQARHGRRGPILLREAEQRARKHDDEDDLSVEPLA